jgi:hypothetical protein
MKNTTNSNIDEQFTMMLRDVESNKDCDRAEQIEGCLELFMQENNLAESLVEKAIFLYLKLTLDKELVQKEVVRKDYFFLSTGHSYCNGYISSEYENNN